MRTTSHIVKAAILSAFVLSLAAGPVFAEGAGQYVDDATITTKVKASFLKDAALKGSKISVETDQASVQLTGLVTSKDQEDEAVRVANQVSGVKNVEDHLNVRSVTSSTSQSE